MLAQFSLSLVVIVIALRIGHLEVIVSVLMVIKVFFRVLVLKRTKNQAFYMNVNALLEENSIKLLAELLFQ